MNLLRQKAMLDTAALVPKRETSLHAQNKAIHAECMKPYPRLGLAACVNGLAACNAMCEWLSFFMISMSMAFGTHLHRNSAKQ